MSQPGQLGHGIPPRPPITELARRIADLTRSLQQVQATLTRAIQRNTAQMTVRLGQTSISTANGIGNNTETLRLSAGPFTVYNGRNYKITGKCQPRCDTAGGYTTMRLKWDTTAAGVGGTLVDASDKDHRAANRSETLFSAGDFIYAGADGDQIYIKMTMQTASGIGTDDPAQFPLTWLTFDAIPNG